MVIFNSYFDITRGYHFHAPRRPRDVGAHTVAHSNSLGAARSSVQRGRCEGPVLPVSSVAWFLYVFITKRHGKPWLSLVTDIYTWWVFEVYVQLPGNGMEFRKWFIDPAKSPAGTPRRFGCKVLPRFQRHSRRVGILRTRNL